MRDSELGENTVCSRFSSAPAGCPNWQLLAAWVHSQSFAETLVYVYIRDLELSGELSNGDTVNFVRQDDLRAGDFNNTQFEYGLEYEGHNDKEPIKQPCDSLPFCLSPAQAIKGWVRFMANTNPDNLESKAFKLTVVDSLGDGHPITKAATEGRKGKVGLRRVGS